MEIAEFLLARIDEDEAEIAAGFDFAALDSSGWMGHAATWGRERALGECKAKRAIIETRQLVDEHIRRVGLASPDEARDARNTRAGLDVAIAALAMPYADHEDYREEWSRLEAHAH